MTTTRGPRRSFLLVELMLVIAIGSIAMLVLGKILLNGIYLQRVAAQHAARARMINFLSRDIRRDANSAVGYQWSDGTDKKTLTLHSLAGGRPLEIRYVIEASRVTRHVGSVESRRWESERLAFDADIERGPLAELLALSFVELPAPRAAHLPNRRYRVLILLPTGLDDARQSEEGS